MRTRASPVPEDDFEVVALAEAKEYAAVQENAAARKRVSEENAERKKQGLAAKKLPPKIVPKAAKGKGRVRRSNSVTSEQLSSGDERGYVEYEGQVMLPFDPLPLLARTRVDTPVSLVRGAEAKPNRRGQSKSKRERMSEPHSPLGKNPNPSSDIQLDVKPDIEIDVKPKTELDIKPDINLDVKPKFEHNLKTKVELDVKPDIKPEVEAKTEPRIPTSSGSAAPSPLEGRWDQACHDAPVVNSDYLPRTDDHSAESAESEALEDDDEYDEEDMIVTVPWASDTKTAPQAVVEDASSVVDDGEEDEQYSDDDLFHCKLPRWPTLTKASISTGEPSQRATDSISKSVDKWQERPNFPATPEQRLRGPYLLDKENPAMAIPASINRFLRDYQRDGTQFLYNKYKQGVGGILGDDMG
ncbi:hypothetical protein Q8F55_000869 [Vanrija albida]|uniref:Inner centromere protein ARK-binding domain-containing protein n=1 Tax=Vanrija albida TaxID=181172 RepID=A0ABR3QEP6_9TREE